MCPMAGHYRRQRSRWRRSSLPHPLDSPREHKAAISPLSRHRAAIARRQAQTFSLRPNGQCHPGRWQSEPQGVTSLGEGRVCEVGLPEEQSNLGRPAGTTPCLPPLSSLSVFAPENLIPEPITFHIGATNQLAGLSPQNSPVFYVFRFLDAHNNLLSSAPHNRFRKGLAQSFTVQVMREVHPMSIFESLVETFTGARITPNQREIRKLIQRGFFQRG